MGNQRYSCGPEPDLAGQRAGDLLRAWISGDAGRLENEIESILSDRAGDCDDGEEERANLLRAVALRMKSCPDVFRLPRNASLDLCLNLLGHLVAEESDGAPLGWPRKAKSRAAFRLTRSAGAAKPALRLV
jgi:hypothetical protein